MWTFICSSFPLDSTSYGYLSPEYSFCLLSRYPYVNPNSFGKTPHGSLVTLGISCRAIFKDRLDAEVLKRALERV